MQTRLKIDEMTCASCARHIAQALKSVPKVTEVRVDLDKGAIVDHDDADKGALVRAVRTAGNYFATVIE